MTTQTGSDNQRASGSPDMSRVSLLWALPGHAEVISRLHAASFDDGWDIAAVAALLAHPGSIAMVATYGVPVTVGAFALAQVAADEAEILTIAVDPRWRRKGVAARLVEGIKRGALRSGAQTLFLEVAASNEPAIALYLRAGFVEAGRRRDYYAKHGGAREDAIVMRCALDDGTSSG